MNFMAISEFIGGVHLSKLDERIEELNDTRLSEAVQNLHEPLVMPGSEALTLGLAITMPLPKTLLM